MERVVSQSGSGAASVNIESYDWLGFDLDHALARYQVQAVMRLVYACLTRALEETKGWPRSAFTTAPEGLESVHEVHDRILDAKCRVGDGLDGTHDGHGLGWNPLFIQKGLIFDFDTGDLLKLDEHGCIVRAYHGLSPVGTDGLADTYGTALSDGRIPWTPWKFELLRTQSRHESFFVLVTYFDAPCQLSLCQGVHWLDNVGGEGFSLGAISRDVHATAAPVHCANPHEPPARDASRPVPRYSKLWTDHNSCFNHMFDNVTGMETGRGGFFPALQAHPERYLRPRHKVGEWLRGQRANGRRILLVTNSHVRYARFTLNTILGSGWQSCFDIICYNGLKPAWFHKVVPWLEVDESGLVHASVTPAGAPSPVGEGSPTLRVRLAPVAAKADAVQFLQGNCAAFQMLADADVAARAAADSPAIPLSQRRLQGSHATIVLHLDEVGHALRCSDEQTGATAGQTSPHGAHGKQHGGNAPHPAIVEPSFDRDHASFHGAGPGNYSTAGTGAGAVATITAGLTDALEDLVNASTGVPLDEADAGELDGTGGEKMVMPVARARVLYAGDHIHGDVVASAAGNAHRTALLHHPGPAWDALAIVEELDPLVFSPQGLWGDFFVDEKAPTVGTYFASLLQRAASFTLADVEELCGLHLSVGNLP